MKKYILILIASIFAINLSLFASPKRVKDKEDEIEKSWRAYINLDYTDANVVGHVLDEKTREHIPGIRIDIKGTNIVTVTDNTGHYFLKNLPEGNYEVVASGLGFKSMTKKVVFKKGKTLEIDFELPYDMLALDAVVVAANRNETKRSLAPTLVKVLDSGIFEKVQATSLSESLNFQPGVRMEDNCQNCGFSQVRINGMEGSYSQILIDSRPVFSALAGVYGLEQIPANMIERIEVVRGGGSALYGSSAIAGTINIITKEPIRNSYGFSHEIKGIGGLHAFQNVTSFDGSVISDNGRLGASFFGQTKNRQPYDDDGDGYSELPKLNSNTLGLRAFWKTSDRSKITAEYHNSHEYRRGGNAFDKEPFDSGITEQLRHNNHVGSIDYNIFSRNLKHDFKAYASFMKVNRGSYYGGGDVNRNDESVSVDDRLENINARLASYGTTKGLTFIVGSQYAYSFDKCLFMPAQLTVGAEYMKDKLDDISGYRQEDISQTVHTESVLAQNEWKNKKLSLLLGARLDKHSLLDDPVICPRMNIRYNPVHNLAFRFNYGKGFRAPQIFDEDLHVDNAGGDLIVSKNAPNLKEEISHSFDLSMNWYLTKGEWFFNLITEGFYTHLEDAFTTTVENKTNSKGQKYQEKIRSNTGNAKVYGLSLDSKLAYGHHFDIEGGVTIQRSLWKDKENWHEDDTYATRRMYRTPNLYGYFVATANITKAFKASFSGNYTGSMLAGHEIVTNEDGTLGLFNGKPASTIHKDRLKNGAGQTTETFGARTFKTPSFFEFGAKLSYDLKIMNAQKLTLYLAVQNIFNAFQDDFDKGPDRDSAYIYGPGMPRSYIAGVKFSF